MSTPSSATLRNKGCPITLYQLDPAGRPALNEAGDEPLTEVVYVRFTANEIAELEDRYDGIEGDLEIPVMGPERDKDGKAVPLKDAEGNVVTRTEHRVFEGIEGFQYASGRKNTKVTRDTIALCLGRKTEDVGRQMIPGQSPQYNSALAAAWSMANGVSPEVAGKVIARASREGEAKLEEMNAEMLVAMDRQEKIDAEKAAKEAEATPGPGPDGSTSGSSTPSPEDADAELTSSGV